MPLLAKHNRNHSFPPCLRFVNKSLSKHLSPPLPNIDDEPWVHFLSPVSDDDDPHDFLDFKAGILTNSELTKKKPSKFRPANEKKWNHKAVNYHHGTYRRVNEDHGFVENRHDPWSHIVEHDVMTTSHPSDASKTPVPRGRSKARTLSGHRHSWREPSVDLFTVAEEGAEIAIVVDDYDDYYANSAASDSTADVSVFAEQENRFNKEHASGDAKGRSRL
jgi:hypothetical protein